jgi:peptidoglycan hydrolase-like protein with peptidoglycan-binding domain
MLKRSLTTLSAALLSGALLELVLLLPSAANAGSSDQAWVERAQQRLNSLGCNAGPVDGDIGEWTRSAIIRFQSRHGFDQTGRLGSTTRARLYSDQARRCDTRPVPARTGAGRRVVVSQRQNWVWLVARDGRTVAQSGIIDNPGELGKGVTRVGSFCGRSARIKRNTDGGDLWLENYVRFAPCGFGFHRIPTYKSNGEQIHPTWMVGTNLRESHGCIRLPKPFSKKMWDFARIGTPVHVVHR